MPVKTLFDLPIAHRNDPLTSWKAGDKMIATGALTKNQKVVYIAIQRYCGIAGITAKELARCMEKAGAGSYWYLYYKIQRRLNELAHRGLIEHFMLPNGEILEREGCCVWRIKMTGKEI